MQPTAIHAHDRIAFIQACWHKDIVDQARKGFVAEMANHGYAESDIDFFEVGGAFEIPLHAKLLAKTGRYGGVVAAGLVVDGGIYRHEFVAQSVISALMQSVVATAATDLAARGVTPPMLRSGNVDGGHDWNAKIFDEYRERIFYRH